MSMEVKNLRGRTACIELPGALVAVYRLTERDVLLFDSGREESPELMDLLEREGLRVRAVICTHLHEDHIANNEQLAAQYGAEIYAAAEEIRTSRWRSTFPYPIHPIEDGDVLTIDGAEIRLLPMPGHTEGQLAYVTPDDVCCVGDAIVTEETLERAKIPYMDDVDGSIVSMECLRQTAYPLYVVAHMGVVAREELSALIDRNIQKELDLYELLRRQITGPAPMDQIITEFIRGAGVLSQKMVEQDYVRFTVRARVLALIHAGEFSLEDGVVAPAERGNG